MQTFGYNQPVRNLQGFLRNISFHNQNIPSVIPDGIFGTQTENAVIAFQTEFQLPVTGEVDNETWNAIVSVHDSIIEVHGEPADVRLFPFSLTQINAYERSEALFAIQGILYALTRYFDNLGTLKITGVHDDQSIRVVKNIQQMSGLDPDGNINKATWHKIASLYEVFVSRDRVAVSGNEGLGM